MGVVKNRHGVLGYEILKSVVSQEWIVNLSYFFLPADNDAINVGYTANPTLYLWLLHTWYPPQMYLLLMIAAHVLMNRP